MKIEVKIHKTDLKSIVESVLTDRYKFDYADDDFAEKVEIAMSNVEFMKEIHTTTFNRKEENNA